jgi:hypothetical protein
MSEREYRYQLSLNEIEVGQLIAVDRFAAWYAWVNLLSHDLVLAIATCNVYAQTERINKGDRHVAHRDAVR